LVNSILAEPGAEFGLLDVDMVRFAIFQRELRLSAQPSVDAFLEHRPEFMDVGKMAIAYHLTRHEIEERLYNATPEEHWYKYILHRITDGTPFEDVSKNQVGFITFNYDRSLEHFLYNSIRATYGCNAKEVEEVLRKFKILHVHGALGGLGWQTDEPGIRAYDNSCTRRDIEVAAKSIKIISDTVPWAEAFGKAWDLLSHAKRVGVLGFGYHRDNMARLKLPTDKHIVFGTCHGLTEAEQAQLQSQYPGLRLHSRKNLDFLRSMPEFQAD
jgi:hypothetical protein